MPKPRESLFRLGSRTVVPKMRGCGSGCRYPGGMHLAPQVVKRPQNVNRSAIACAWHPADAARDASCRRRAVALHFVLPCAAPPLQGPAALRGVRVQQETHRCAGRQPAGKLYALPAWERAAAAAAAMSSLLQVDRRAGTARHRAECLLPPVAPCSVLKCPHATHHPALHSRWTSPPPPRRARSTCSARRRWRGSRAAIASCRRRAPPAHLRGSPCSASPGQAPAAAPPPSGLPPAGTFPPMQVLRVREMLKRGLGVHHAGRSPTPHP